MGFGRGGLFGAGVGLFVASFGQVAGGAEPEALGEESTLRAWLATAINERAQPCDFRAMRPVEGGAYIACGAAGLWHLRTGSAAGPTLAASYAVEGEAVGFAEVDGRLWVKIESVHARPVDAVTSGGAPVASPSLYPLPAPAPPAARFDAPAPTTPAAAAPPATAPAQLSPTVPVGRVVESLPGVVIVSLGLRHSIASGDRIELSAERSERLGGDEQAVSKDSLAVGVVTHASDGYSRVQLGVNEDVPVGAIAEPTRAPSTSSLSAPPRAGGFWEAHAMARPFVALEELGGGLLLSGSIGYRAAGSLYVQAYVDPIGIADVEGSDSVSVANGAVAVSYDSRFLEMGIGLGAQTVRATAFDVEAGSGLAIAQVLRLGARDGLNLHLRSSVVLFHSEFDFGGVVVTGQIPVSRGYWLMLSGGGGNVGYGFGEIGLRVLLRGNGGRGSTFLTATGGGAGVFQSEVCTDFECSGSKSYGGAMAGIGAEWRF